MHGQANWSRNESVTIIFVTGNTFNVIAAVMYCIVMCYDIYVEWLSLYDRAEPPVVAR